MDDIRILAGQNVPVYGGGRINTRPGQALNLSVEQVKQFIRTSKRCKGQVYDLSTGANTALEVSLPGTAKMMLGFALVFTGQNNDSPSGYMTMQINNDIVIDNVEVTFFSGEFTDEEYYFFPFPLSGQDDITITIEDVILAYTLNVNFYYI